MNILAATVTVCFIGLVHFHNVVDETGGDVIVPTTPPADRRGVTLVEHRADIVVQGFSGTESKCKDDLGGDEWLATPPTCIFKDLSATRVELPGSSSSLDDFDATPRFGDIPRLKNVCTGTPGTDIGALKDEYKASGTGYAVRVALTKGMLDACPNGAAWEAILTLQHASGPFKIGGQEVPLQTNAVIKIINAPEPAVHSEDPAEEKKHFWWYYKMYTGADTCEGMPVAMTRTCPPAMSKCRGHDAATGVGCSVTQYP